jgi:hypothetical protein
VQFSSVLVGFSGWREGGLDGMVVEHVSVCQPNYISCSTCSLTIFSSLQHRRDLHGVLHSVFVKGFGRGA